MVRQFDYELERIKDEETDNLNISQAFDGIGKFGEILTTAIFAGSIGSASKGGCAFDNHCLLTNKKREVKTCCIIQPKICNSCTQINKDNEAAPSSAAAIVSSILAEIIEKIAAPLLVDPPAHPSPNQTKVPFFKRGAFSVGKP